MKWVTRRNIHVDRTSCPWLIRRFIDPVAEFVFVEPTADPATLDGHTVDMRGAEYSHKGDNCTFQVMVKRHGLDSHRCWSNCVASSTMQTCRPAVLVDWYAYCQAKVQAPRPHQGAPGPRLRYSQRVATHIDDDDHI